MTGWDLDPSFDSGFFEFEQPEDAVEIQFLPTDSSPVEAR